MKLLFMRHGETLWNSEGRLQGQTDIPLNDRGIKMAVSCGKGMKDVGIDICFSSPLKRSKETAEMVLAENEGYPERALSVMGRQGASFGAGLSFLGKDGLETVAVKRADSSGMTKGFPIVTDLRLKEASFGPWEGLICKADGYNVPIRDFSAYWREPYSRDIPDGVERIAHVAQRLYSFIQDVTSAPELKDAAVLIITHGCVMRALTYIIGGKKSFVGKIPLNCEIIETVPDGRGGLFETGRKIYYDRAMIHDYYATMQQE